MGSGKAWKQKPGIVCEEVDGELVLVDLDADLYFSLMGSAPTIWSALDAPITEGELVEVVQNRYALQPEVARRDVGRFIEELANASLIERV